MPQEVIDSMPSDTFLDGELWFVYSIETKPWFNSMLSWQVREGQFPRSRQNIKQGRPEHHRLEAFQIYGV